MSGRALPQNGHPVPIGCDRNDVARSEMAQVIRQAEGRVRLAGPQEPQKQAVRSRCSWLLGGDVRQGQVRCAFVRAAYAPHLVRQRSPEVGGCVLAESLIIDVPIARRGHGRNYRRAPGAG